MKVEVKKVDALKRELKFEISRDRVTKAMDEVYGEISKHAKIKGFRPGKVPRHILVSSHGKIAQEETIKKLIPEAYREGIVQNGINPIDMPEISDVALKDGALSFTATLDIRPEVKLGNYKGIKVTRRSNEVTEEDINKTLEFFKKGQGDKEVTIDDAFAKGMGFPSLEEFKKALTRQLEYDKDRQNRMDVENQIVEDLVKNAKLIVPQSLHKRQMERRLQDTLSRLKSQGMSPEEITKKTDEIRKQLEEVVERDIKVYLILEEIAIQEKVQVEDPQHLPHKVMEVLLKEANWQNEDVKADAKETKEKVNTKDTKKGKG